MNLSTPEWIEQSDYAVIAEPCARGTIHQFRKEINGVTLRWGDFVIDVGDGVLEQQINGSVDLGGCSRHCGFCASAGKSDYSTLTGNEIAGQFLLARRHLLRAQQCGWAGGLLGEGENSDDPGAVSGAIDEISQWPDVPRSFLLSTTGKDCDQFMDRMADDARKLSPGVLKLQVSATSTDPAVRKRWMQDSPPLKVVLPAARDFAARTDTKVKFNFPLMLGINDSEQELRGIIDLVRKNPWIQPKISSYNSIGRNKFKPAGSDAILQFVAALQAEGIDARAFIADTSLHSMNCGVVTALQIGIKSSLDVLPHRTQ